MASNYQLSHLRPCRESNPGLRGGRRECYHSATVAPVPIKYAYSFNNNLQCAVINAQSVRNKPLVIADFVADNDLDFLAITETWLKQD